MTPEHSQEFVAQECDSQEFVFDLSFFDSDFPHLVSEDGSLPFHTPPPPPRKNHRPPRVFQDSGRGATTDLSKQVVVSSKTRLNELREHPSGRRLASCLFELKKVFIHNRRDLFLDDLKWNLLRLPSTSTSHFSRLPSPVQTLRVNTPNLVN